MREMRGGVKVWAERMYLTVPQTFGVKDSQSAPIAANPAVFAAMKHL
jgi:hypothetical protein